nr:TPA_asm: adenain [Larimichthys croaker adintovirus]
MNNHELENLLHRLLGDVFCGVWASDQLPLLTRSFDTPVYFIVNTHPAHLPGEHWLSLTLEEDGVATFFDSYGFPPDFAHYPSSILQFLEQRSDRILYHDRQLQHTLSTVCGQHCVYYLCHRACGVSFERLLSLYDDDVIKNDQTVSHFVEKYRRCIRNRSSGCFNHGTCSLQMFNQCYNL